MTVKKKVTRDDVLKSIIKLINEYREDAVGEDASLGRLHIGPSMLIWIFDWLKEEYKMVGMTMPEESEVTHLLQRDTIGTLADIAMKHIPEYREYEIEEESKPGEEVKSVSIKMSSGDCQSFLGPENLTKEEFLKLCGEFFDARGTHVNDYEFMTVRINETEKEEKK